MGTDYKLLNKHLWVLVEEGKLAYIKVNGSADDEYVNAGQVYVKCNHCGKITNTLKIKK